MQLSSQCSCFSDTFCIRKHMSAYVSICQHTSSQCSCFSDTFCIRQHMSAYVQPVLLFLRHLLHTSAYVSIRPASAPVSPTPSAYVSVCQHTSSQCSCFSDTFCIRQHAPAYVSIRQHTSAYLQRSLLLPLCIRQNTSAYVSIRQHTFNARSSCPSYVGMRRHASAYVSIRQHTSAYLQRSLLLPLYLSILPHLPLSPSMPPLTTPVATSRISHTALSLPLL
jgi:hypothetical protein